MIHCQTLMTDDHRTRRSMLWATYVAGTITTILAVYFGYQYTVEVRERQLEQFRSELIIASSPSAIIMCREDGTIIDSNLTAEQLFGWEHHLLIGQKADVLMPEEVRPLHNAGMERAVQRMRELPAQENWMVSKAALHVRGIHRDGKTFVDLEANIRVIKLRDGSIQFLTYFRPMAESPAEESIEQLPQELAPAA